MTTTVLSFDLPAPEDIENGKTWIFCCEMPPESRRAGGEHQRRGTVCPARDLRQEIP
jgi:hypothetical protein